jgi:hypothetical protein
MANGKKLLWLCIPLITLSFSMPAAAGSVKPGAYCPNRDLRLSIAEELAVSLDLTMKSRAAQIDKDSTAAISDLASAGTTLHMAAGHGAAARTMLLIDAIIQAKAGEDYAQMLATWFPLLRASLRTLPNDVTVNAAGDLINRAEDFMQGDSEGDPLDLLSQARLMLGCDKLDIPLQKAVQAQRNLIKRFKKSTKVNAYDTLLNALHSALNYTLASGNGSIE